jgi:hypothetical protein
MHDFSQQAIFQGLWDQVMLKFYQPDIVPSPKTLIFAPLGVAAAS